MGEVLSYVVAPFLLQGALTAIEIAALAMVFGLTLGGPYLFYKSQDFLHDHAEALKWGALLSWLATTGLGVVSGHSQKTSDGRGAHLLEGIGSGRLAG